MLKPKKGSALLQKPSTLKSVLRALGEGLELGPMRMILLSLHTSLRLVTPNHLPTLWVDPPLPSLSTEAAG